MVLNYLNEMEKLNETSGKNPFKIPENYFNEVNRKIISASSGYNTEAKKVNMYDKIKPYLAIAAFVSGLILISYTALKLLRSNDVNDRVPQISMQEFSESYLNDIEIITLEESGAALLQSEEVPYINHSDIIDYLLLENIPVNEIYELL